MKKAKAKAKAKEVDASKPASLAHSINCKENQKSFLSKFKFKSDEEIYEILSYVTMRPGLKNELMSAIKSIEDEYGRSKTDFSTQIFEGNKLLLKVSNKKFDGDFYTHLQKIESLVGEDLVSKVILHIE